MSAASKIGMVALAFVMLFAVSAFGTTRFIAQSAGTFSGGTACNGQTTLTVTAWNGITNSAGDVNYICGTITFSAGSNGLVARGSGSSGSPVQLIFDTGAILQSPAFGGSPGGSVGGALVFNGVNYWTINGQNTGTIQNTADGTPGQTTCVSGSCTVNQNTVGIWISNATGVTVQNLTVRNIYMDKNGAGSWSDAGYTTDVWIGGPASAITLSGSTLNDAHTGIWAGFDNGTITGLTIGPSNTVDHHAWGISWANGNSSSGTSSTGSIYGNSIGNFSDWNLSGNNGWHTDGIITYTYNLASFTPYVYNNYFYGDLDGGTGAGTAHISVGTVYGADATNGTGSGYVFNNVIDMTGNTHCAAGMWDQGKTVSFYNNTVIGPSSCSTGTSIGIMIESTAATLENNIFSTLSQMIGGYGTVGADIAVSNDNVFYNCLSTCFGFGDGAGPNYSTLSSLQTATGLDKGSSAGDPKLTSFVPQAGSSATGLGANLTSLNVAALDLDKASVQRPASGAWDAGAYQDPPASVVAPPSGLTAAVQ